MSALRDFLVGDALKCVLVNRITPNFSAHWLHTFYGEVRQTFDDGYNVEIMPWSGVKFTMADIFDLNQPRSTNMASSSSMVVFIPKCHAAEPEEWVYKATHNLEPRFRNCALGVHCKRYVDALKSWVLGQVVNVIPTHKMGEGDLVTVQVLALWPDQGHEVKDEEEAIRLLDESGAGAINLLNSSSRPASPKEDRSLWWTPPGTMTFGSLYRPSPLMSNLPLSAYCQMPLPPIWQNSQMRYLNALAMLPVIGLGREHVNRIFRKKHTGTIYGFTSGPGGASHYFDCRNAHILDTELKNPIFMRMVAPPHPLENFDHDPIREGETFFVFSPPSEKTKTKTPSANFIRSRDYPGLEAFYCFVRTRGQHPSFKNLSPAQILTLMGPETTSVFYQLLMPYFYLDYHSPVVDWFKKDYCFPMVLKKQKRRERKYK